MFKQAPGLCYKSKHFHQDLFIVEKVAIKALVSHLLVGVFQKIF